MSPISQKTNNMCGRWRGSGEAFRVWNTFCFCNLGLFVNLLMGLDFPWQIAVELALYSIVKIPLTGGARPSLLRTGGSGVQYFSQQSTCTARWLKRQCLKSLNAVEQGRSSAIGPQRQKYPKIYSAKPPPGEQRLMI